MEETLAFVSRCPRNIRFTARVFYLRHMEVPDLLLIIPVVIQICATARSLAGH